MWDNFLFYNKSIIITVIIHREIEQYLPNIVIELSEFHELQAI